MASEADRVDALYFVLVFDRDGLMLPAATRICSTEVLARSLARELAAGPGEVLVAGVDVTYLAFGFDHP